jgi:hypothetical protein
MNHLAMDLTLAHQALRREEAAVYRRSRAVLPRRAGPRLSAVLARVRRPGRRIPTPATHLIHHRPNLQEIS